uniref:Uncharacterized protein n=2 Tax=Anguilla anguilla TaxID=7936 RepID=A0A0E9UFV1_ANGAN
MPLSLFRERVTHSVSVIIIIILIIMHLQNLNVILYFCYL